ncbi:diaminopropionate ammonia-lyase [Vibrio profundum]|uniref:diaminopropionate ammonia-lyase n=1 Tax=Vibrio profundum TaxID=2910247 RepID=UPI003D0BE890
MIAIEKNKFYTGQGCEQFSARIAHQTRVFHRHIEDYQPTPLVSLDHLASFLGVKAILVKDESKRFGLNAFKVLGGSYALGKHLAEKLNIEVSELNLSIVADQLGDQMTFVTATAGNHGVGIAWAAKKMGQKAVVYMPRGSSAISVSRVKALGANCIVTDCNYDDTVRLAGQAAENNDWTLVQDTAWEGYEEIPTWISQGYTTMADEAIEQAQRLPFGMPTHVILQAGVGAMAGGVLGYLSDRLGPHGFQSIIAEPSAADCLYRSSKNELGDTVTVGGELNSLMAGLACGEPNPVTWPILKQCSNYFASVDDEIAELGMRVLGRPLDTDDKIISGESGAMPAGLLYQLCGDEAHNEIRQELGLNEDSIVMLFSTEGDTNPDRYRQIMKEEELKV